MSKVLKRLGIAVLIIGIVLSATMLFYRYPIATQVPYQVQVPYEAQVPYQVEVPYNATITQAQTLDHKENYQIQTGHAAYSKFTLETGNTLVVTWQTDNAISAYIVTPSQFSMVQLIGSPSSSLARKTDLPSGSLLYQIPSADTYYVVLCPSSNDVNVASYKSELQWQEQVIKYRNETQYRAETQYRTETQYKTEAVYTSSSLGINLGITISVLGAILLSLGLVNLKPITIRAKTIKNLNVSTCAYCNATYKKSLDKCPHCGARKKA